MYYIMEVMRKNILRDDITNTNFIHEIFTCQTHTVKINLKNDTL